MPSPFRWKDTPFRSWEKSTFLHFRETDALSILGKREYPLYSEKVIPLLIPKKQKALPFLMPKSDLFHSRVKGYLSLLHSEFR